MLSVVGAYQAVHGGVDLVVNIATLALAERNRSVDEALVSGLVRCCEDERWVGGSILGLVDIDSCARVRSASSRSHLRLEELTLEVTGVGHDNGTSLLELVESGGHGGRR